MSTHVTLPTARLAKQFWWGEIRSAHLATQVLLALAAAVTVIPVIWTVLSSLKSNDTMFAVPMLLQRLQDREHLLDEGCFVRWDHFLAERRIVLTRIHDSQGRRNLPHGLDTMQCTVVCEWPTRFRRSR